jgi:hypothetical protein
MESSNADSASVALSTVITPWERGEQGALHRHVPYLASFGENIVN